MYEQNIRVAIVDVIVVQQVNHASHYRAQKLQRYIGHDHGTNARCSAKIAPAACHSSDEPEVWLHRRLFWSSGAR